MSEHDQPDDKRFDAMLRDLGQVEIPEDAADRFWERLRPRLEDHRTKLARWIFGPRWVLGGATAALAAVILGLALWLNPFGDWLGSANRREMAGLFVPREYDPTLDFIVFRNRHVLAYQPAAIGGDLKVFLEALELFPARLQWLAVSGEQIQIGLDSGPPPTEPRPVANRGAGTLNEMLCSQIHVFRLGAGESRPFAARVLALPGSQIHLDAKSLDGAPVGFSMSLQQVARDVCPVRVDLDYGSKPPVKIRKEMDVKLDQPTCIGTFGAGKARCFVYVTVRRIPFVMRDLPPGA